MPRFAANLSMLYPELPFLDRFEAAAKDGFEAVEYLFPYAYPAEELVARLKAQPEVKLAVAVIKEGSANIYISLREDRKTTSIEFERRLAPQLQAVPDARVSFATQSMGAGSGRDVDTVVVNGRIVMQGRQLPGIDLASLRDRAQAQYEKLISTYPERSPGNPPVEQIFAPSFPLM